MNEHIRRANEAIVAGDRDTALMEYYEALHDPTSNEIDRRIARHRLVELAPSAVYASRWSNLYHRPNCGARQAIYQRNRIAFNDWRDAETAGYKQCPTCKPPRGGYVDES